MRLKKEKNISMAIRVEFYNVIIPISHLEKLPGGFKSVLKEHKGIIGKKVWCDDFLFKDGAMGSGGIEKIVKKWSDRGLDVVGQNERGKYWKELCVVDHAGNSTLPCEWLSNDCDGKNNYYVYCNHHSVGEIVGRSNI